MMTTSLSCYRGAMPDRPALVYDVLRPLRPLVLNSARVVEDRVRAEGWTVGMRAVVEVLAEGGEATVPAIGRRMDLPRQAVQRHVDDLRARRHVTTRSNPAHRRSMLITLTDAGRAAFDRVRTSELAELAGLAPECSDTELRTAIRVLTALERDVRAKAGERREALA